MSSGSGLYSFLVATLLGGVAMIISTASVDKSWRDWAVQKGVAEYDRTTGKWTELPGCPKTEGK